MDRKKCNFIVADFYAGVGTSHISQAVKRRDETRNVNRARYAPWPMTFGITSGRPPESVVYVFGSPSYAVIGSVYERPTSGGGEIVLIVSGSPKLGIATF